MDYVEQLQQTEWKEKRNQVLTRDNFECKKCHVKRSDFLGLDFKFGILAYKEFLNQGFKVTNDFKSNSIEITKDGTKVNFINLAECGGHLDLEKLSFAKRWIDGKNKFMFPSLQLICFQTEALDEGKYFDLNVHHRYYIKGRKAWEYENEAFLTLCINCHKEEHEMNSIPILDEHNVVIASTIICDRCNGKGVLPEFKYFKHGVCFKCNGLGNLIDSNYI
jgi:5-methylcytosine-specific restriction endonuclease McrA